MNVFSHSTDLFTLALMSSSHCGEVLGCSCSRFLGSLVSRFLLLTCNFIVSSNNVLPNPRARRLTAAAFALVFQLIYFE